MLICCPYAISFSLPFLLSKVFVGCYLSQSCRLICSCQIHHPGEQATLVLKEEVGSIKLSDPAGTQHHDAVRVHDGVQPVSNGESGAVHKLSTNGLLDDGISAGQKKGEVGSNAKRPTGRMPLHPCYNAKTDTYVMSTFAVASSMTRILLRLSRARARHTS